MMVRPENSRVKHGDPTCADYGCRREDCLEVRRRKQKRNKFLRQSGRPGMVPSDRAAAHLKKFRDAGFQDAEIISVTRLARNTFYRIMRGEPMTRNTERKVLSVPAPRPVREIRTLATVDATATHRRLQALMWLGWPSGVLEQRMGVHDAWISRSFRVRTRVTLAIEARVRALYDECWTLQPEQAGTDPVEASTVRRHARKRGWAGPLAWDDQTIGDPKTLPQTDALEPVTTEGENVAARWLLGESVILSPEARKEVLAHLFEWTNDTIAEIAAQLDMTPEAAEQAWERLKKKAALDGRRMWRRVYVPRERTLKQDQMEEAA